MLRALDEAPVDVREGCPVLLGFEYKFAYLFLGMRRFEVRGGRRRIGKVREGRGSDTFLKSHALTH